MTDVERFVHLFTERWAAGDPPLAELLHPEGKMLHPGMGQPIGPAEAPAYIARIKSALPGIRLEVRDWATRGDAVFIEWTIRATLRGVPVRWDGADRFTLRDGLATDGVAYFDTLPIIAAVDPTFQLPDLLRETAPQT